jgi:hypothetical protein
LATEVEGSDHQPLCPYGFTRCPSLTRRWWKSCGSNVLPVRSEAQLVSKVVNWVLRTLLLCLVSRSVDEVERIIERFFWLLERERERERERRCGGKYGGRFRVVEAGDSGGAARVDSPLGVCEADAAAPLLRSPV